MFGNNTYWWLGLIVFLVFIGLNVVTFLLRNKPKASYLIAYLIATYLLVEKIVEYTIYQAQGEHLHIPLEFSALSYFIFAILITFRVKKLDEFGDFVAMLAGLMYSVSFWVSPDTHVNDNAGNTVWFVLAAINHHLLYFGGLLIAANVREYKWKSWWVFAVFIGIMVGYSWLLYGTTNYGALYGKPIIIKITDGSILEPLTHKAELEPWALALWVVGALSLLALLVAGFFLLNRWQSKRREKKGIPADNFPPKWLDTFKLK